MNFHSEILPVEQQKALRLLAPVADLHGFYLGGGTAIALLLGHRYSVDFDWFTGDTLADPLLLASQINNAGIPFITRQIDRGTLHGTVYDVRVTFLEYRYPLLQPLTPWPDYGCHLASLVDLTCMKLSAAAQRGSRKDFLDIFALNRQGFTLQEMLCSYQERYQVKDIGHLLYGLSYFDDADQEPMPNCLWDLDWKTVKATIGRLVKKAAQ